ncbi:probable mitochondrial adenine nucleotide transporter BTL3 [Vigna radiata var. radiata]|uniref:Probable mitochondrial adenine nucleotide transporter BTL3 n=1 Tax=Vigna radiata var. radiata TaxID=3916 RepID=A0A1S3US14_VIGRR|nr:probable mitochondrial adenine nucleotide transporter BTL3 [Vigna radiata var. radiata]
MLHLITPPESSDSFLPGGLFLHGHTLPSSFTSYLPPPPPPSFSDPIKVSCVCRERCLRVEGGVGGRAFLSLSLSLNGTGGDQRYGKESGEILGHHHKKVEDVDDGLSEEKEKVEINGSGAVNMTKHLWAGAFAAMVSRTFVAPLERLKLEYIVRGEQKNLFVLIQEIATSQGLKGFWKGNFVNILRTAPFKAINFYAYDTYRNKLTRMLGNEESTNLERFVAGAASGITATLLCLPMDTIRTVMVAPGGEALGGVIGAFRHMIRTEGFFSLYKGLVPSIISMAPSGAVYYGVYDILKSAYLQSPEGRKRIQRMKEEAQDLNALEQLELGPIRTLLYGAIAGCCSEAATYPFEVVRRQLQLQVRATRLNALATCVKIVEQGGVPALYAGLIPSLLQVLPSAAISYFVYEFMKVVLKVESR